jgi:hypothetical protein
MVMPLKTVHLRGKTFDISYRAFNNNKKTNKGFIAVLNELKNKADAMSNLKGTAVYILR